MSLLRFLLRFTNVYSKVRPMNEQFIELFDVDLIEIPEKRPKWIWAAD